MTHIKTLDELREEYGKFYEDYQGDFIDGRTQEMVKANVVPKREAIADYWLERIKERDEELRKEIEGLSVDEKFDDRYKLGFYGATIQVLSILKQENDKR